MRIKNGTPFKSREQHRLRRDIAYVSWRAMWERCTNSKARNFKHYGGKGISVCEQWTSFTAFLNDMGNRPSRKHTIDRIDRMGDYCKENCRWATQTEQTNNTSRNVIITHSDLTMTISEWSQKTGIPRSVIVHRLQRNWTIERALTLPAKSAKAILITHEGKTQNLSAWSRELGINQTTLNARHHRGWSDSEVISGKKMRESKICD